MLFAATESTQDLHRHKVSQSIMSSLRGRTRPKRVPVITQFPGDGRVLEGFDRDDLDETSLREYRDVFAATNPKHPWLALDEKALLEQLGCWRKDRETGNYGLTLAGLLMFGKYDAIITPGAAPTFHVDYRDYVDQKMPGDTWSDRLFPDGTWEANLFQFFQRSWLKLTADLRVPRASKAAPHLDATPVHAALREAVVNALVHTDYGTPGGIVFERYRERFLMENPGTLIVSQEQLRRGGVSQCRNRSLQRMFMLIGGCDQAGAGYRRIRDGWRSQLWPEPNLITQRQPDRIRLDFVMRSALPDQFLATVADQAPRRPREQPWLR
jgi:ATP-dependent DNA helicase RecG